MRVDPSPRELTQSQSILQNQIERFGNHIFEEGSIVTGAQTDVDMELYFVKVKSSNPNSQGSDSAEEYRTSFHGKILQGKTTGVVVKLSLQVQNPRRPNHIIR